MSEQTVQQLTLQLNASVELARTELAQLRGSMEQVDRKAGETQDKLSGAFAGVDKAAGLAKVAVAGFLSSLSIAGIVSFARSITQMADDLATAADQAGVSVERFQTLREGLRVLEVGGDNVSKVLQRLTDALGSVQSGSATKETVNILERMGVLSEVLNGEITSTEQLFDAVAASAGRYNSTAQFTADIIGLVGRKAGVELAAALKDGGVALAGFEQATRDAGAVIDSDLIARLADANEQIDLLKERSVIKVTLLTGDFLRGLDIIDQALEGSSLWKAFLSPAASALQFIKNVDNIRSTALAGPDARTRAERTLSQVAPGTALYESLYSDFVRQFGEDPSISVSANRLGAVIARPGAGSAGGGRGGSAGRAAAVGPTSAQIRNTATAMSGLDGARESLAGNFGMLPSPEALESLRVTISEVDIATARIRSEPLFQERELFIARAASEDIAAAIAGAAVFGDNLGDSLSNAFRRAGAALLQSGILRLLGSVAGSLVPGLGSVFGGFFADGGRPPMGKISVVGERGPELFVPDTPGLILPNDVLGGGGGMTINVDARGSTDPGMVRREVQRGILEALPAIEAGTRANTTRQLGRPRLGGAGAGIG